MSDAIVGADAPAVKKCAACRRPKPITEYDAKRGRPDEPNRSCRECIRRANERHAKDPGYARERARLYQAANREKTKAAAESRYRALVEAGGVPAEKICVRCGEKKSAGNFIADVQSRDGLKPRCNACIGEARKRHLRNDPAAAERVRESRRKYKREKPEQAGAWDRNNPDKRKAYGREHMRRKRAADPKGENQKQKEWRAKNPDKVKAARRRGLKRHPDRHCERVMRREAKKKGATIGPVAPIKAFYRQVATAERINCYWCGRNVPKGNRQRHVDHVQPLDRGGAHAAWNLCCSCQKCNSRKSNKTPFEFSGQGHFHFAASLIPQPANT